MHLEYFLCTFQVSILQGVQREFWKTPVDGYLVVFDVTDQVYTCIIIIQKNSVAT